MRFVIQENTQTMECESQERLGADWVAQTMERVVAVKKSMDEELRAVFGTAYAIDEMALMFTDQGWAQRWVTAAVAVPGITLFNSARDTVSTRPVRSEYNVHYLFMTTPDVHHEPGPWRLEVMHLHPGSPLHGSYLATMDGPDAVVMHASFKCPDEEAYAVAVQTLQRNGYEAAQMCTSDYGRFSYWSPEDWPDRADSLTYLKPRVNLRDKEVGRGND